MQDGGDRRAAGRGEVGRSSGWKLCAERKTRSSIVSRVVPLCESARAEALFCVAQHWARDWRALALTQERKNVSLRLPDRAVSQCATLHSSALLARRCGGHGRRCGSRSLGLPPPHGSLSAPCVRLVRRCPLAALRKAARSRGEGGILSLSIVQRSCECSTAPVLWCESLMGGNLLLHRHAQPALPLGAEACCWAIGASFSTLSLASCSICRNTSMARGIWYTARVVTQPRRTGGAVREARAISYF